ncbi:MAG: lysophospholipid acyltransferase family protein [Magnetococcales bacterium]|nr:lysophospholipid acyltransferase family protein [Magnetococcales bacterium]
MSDPVKIKLRHRLEWLLLRGGMAWLQQGDLAAAYGRVHRLAGLMRVVLRSEWAWANTNLQWVYGPHITATQRRQLARMAFENILCSHLDGMRQDPFQWAESQPEQSFQPLSDAFQQGRGLIVCGIHLGAWEVGLKQFAALGFPIHVVYRHANNPLSERVFMEARAAYGVRWIRRDDPRQILRVLQKKEILVLMTDINQRQDGIVAPFLGIPARCPAGAARLSRRFQVPLVPMVCLRAAPGQIFVRSAAAIEPSTCADEVSLTGRINASFEEWIHTYAEQYNWLHARWRSRPDGVLWHPGMPMTELQGARVAPHVPLSDRVQRLLAEAQPG